MASCLPGAPGNAGAGIPGIPASGFHNVGNAHQVAQGGRAAVEGQNGRLHVQRRVLGDTPPAVRATQERHATRLHPSWGSVGGPVTASVTLRASGPSPLGMIWRTVFEVQTSPARPLRRQARPLGYPVSHVTQWGRVWRLGEASRSPGQAGAGVSGRHAGGCTRSAADRCQRACLSSGCPAVEPAARRRTCVHGRCGPSRAVRVSARAFPSLPVDPGSGQRSQVPPDHEVHCTT